MHLKCAWHSEVASWLATDYGCHFGWGSAWIRTVVHSRLTVSFTVMDRVRVKDGVCVRAQVSGK